MNGLNGWILRIFCHALNRRKMQKHQRFILCMIWERLKVSGRKPGQPKEPESHLYRDPEKFWESDSTVEQMMFTIFPQKGL